MKTDLFPHGIFQARVLEWVPLPYPSRERQTLVNDEEIEENNRMGKTRDVFKILEIPREHFMKRWAQNKGQNDMDPTEEDDIRRGVKNTQKNCTKKSFTTQITTMV